MGFFLPVFIYIEINACGKRVNVLCNLARGVKSFGIAKVINQPGKFTGHFIGIGNFTLLNFFPAVFILFYKKSFSQFLIFELVKYYFLHMLLCLYFKSLILSCFS